MVDNEYNKIPVFFCKKCLSLNIKVMGEDFDFCEDCGSTDIDQTDIYTWEKMYEQKYGKKFSTGEKTNGRD